VKDGRWGQLEEARDMRILVIGATGLIGKEVVKLLSGDHDVVKIGHKSGEFKVDIASKTSIEELFKKAGRFDALVSCAGEARFGPLSSLSDDDFAFGLVNKLMGQVNLVRVGRKFIADNGSFTLTAGILAREPIPGSASISIINAGVEAFARAAALETERGVRVNAVSPPFLKETLRSLGMDDSSGIPVAQVPYAYRESVESDRTGQVLDPRDFVAAVSAR
jgi:NAD(P)-dependent dehydrogenase (short-subunit alcohol dehydrogenase family)